MVKQVIVMRKDLGMRKGKMIAQGAHAAMKELVLRIKENKPIELDEEEKEWYLGNFRKICVYVNSEEELLDIVQIAKEKDLRVALVTDKGLTEFDGPTNTCCAIGPHDDEKIDEITSELPLL